MSDPDLRQVWADTSVHEPQSTWVSQEERTLQMELLTPLCKLAAPLFARPSPPICPLTRKLVSPVARDLSVEVILSFYLFITICPI